MENVYEIIETSSDETDNSSDEEMEENKELNELNSEFLNYTKVDEYLKNRNTLFTKDIEQIDLEVANNSSISNSSEFTYDFGSLNKYKNIIGIELIDTIIHFANATSAPQVINIIIDDIPYIACIQNNKGKHLIKKIPADTGTNIFQSGIEAGMLNRYFFPITLNNLVIRFEDILGASLELNITHISLIFRLTIVNNLNLLK